MIQIQVLITVVMPFHSQRWFSCVVSLCRYVYTDCQCILLIYVYRSRPCGWYCRFRGRHQGSAHTARCCVCQIGQCHFCCSFKLLLSSFQLEEQTYDFTKRSDKLTVIFILCIQFQFILWFVLIKRKEKDSSSANTNACWGLFLGTLIIYEPCE